MSRFLRAWQDNPQLGPDHAVLMRQVARWHGHNLPIDCVPDELLPYMSHAGLSFVPPYLNAEAFAPSWLSSAIDDSRPQRCVRQEQVPAEGGAQALGFENWQSQAQKEAAWSAVTAPAQSSTLIVLPTGAGKSLCFQLLARYSSGLTVVIVPTVALAIDQCHRARETFRRIPDLHPSYFASNSETVDPQRFLEQVRNGQTRLLFASPEACCSGRLRPLLDQAAREGRFENLVIDEAHLIETWGVYFRVDFQILAGRCREWFSTRESRFRVFLMSATVTHECRELLKELYKGPGEWREFVSQRLRPELSYYLARFDSDSARIQAVRECAWRLPRPAIIYTTEPKDAKEFHRIFTQEEGFQRVGCFHGETPPSERDRLIRLWRDNALDVMIATSAFGVGMDKADIRAVIHACVPENLHRYYQEAGRGGRDGHSALSLLLYTPGDREVAVGLMPKLMTPALLQERWEALWHANRIPSDLPNAEHIYDLPLNARRLRLVATRTWAENIRWNKRLLLQLHRARMLELQDVIYERGETCDDEPLEWARVRLLSFSPTSHEVGARVAVARQDELKQHYRGLEMLDNYLSGGACLGRILRQVYGMNSGHVCGGCSYCRRHNEDSLVRDHDREHECPRLEFECHSRSAPQITVVRDCPNPLELAGESFLRYCVQRRGIRRFLCSPQILPTLQKAMSKAVPEQTTRPYRLDAWAGDTQDAEFLPVRCDIAPGETVAIFHVGVIVPGTEDFRYGNEAIDLMCGVSSALDEIGRNFRASRNPRYVSYANWSQEA